jgi:hypothetical protein
MSRQTYTDPAVFQQRLKNLSELATSITADGFALPETVIHINHQVASLIKEAQERPGISSSPADLIPSIFNFLRSIPTTLLSSVFFHKNTGILLAHIFKTYPGQSQIPEDYYELARRYFDYGNDLRKFMIFHKTHLQSNGNQPTASHLKLFRQLIQKQVLDLSQAMVLQDKRSIARILNNLLHAINNRYGLNVITEAIASNAAIDSRRLAINNKSSPLVAFIYLHICFKYTPTATLKSINIHIENIFTFRYGIHELLSYYSNIRNGAEQQAELYSFIFNNPFITSNHEGVLDKLLTYQATKKFLVMHTYLFVLRMKLAFQHGQPLEPITTHIIERFVVSGMRREHYNRDEETFEFGLGIFTDRLKSPEVTPAILRKILIERLQMASYPKDLLETVKQAYLDKLSKQPGVLPSFEVLMAEKELVGKMPNHLPLTSILDEHISATLKTFTDKLHSPSVTLTALRKILIARLEIATYPKDLLETVKQAYLDKLSKQPGVLPSFEVLMEEKELVGRLPNHLPLTSILDEHIKATLLEPLTINLTDILDLLDPPTDYRSDLLVPDYPPIPVPQPLGPRTDLVPESVAYPPLYIPPSPLSPPEEIVTSAMDTSKRGDSQGDQELAEDHTYEVPATEPHKRRRIEGKLPNAHLRAMAAWYPPTEEAEKEDGKVIAQRRRTERKTPNTHLRTMARRHPSYEREEEEIIIPHVRIALPDVLDVSSYFATQTTQSFKVRIAEGKIIHKRITGNELWENYQRHLPYLAIGESLIVKKIQQQMREDASRKGGAMADSDFLAHGLFIVNETDEPLHVDVIVPFLGDHRNTLPSDKYIGEHIKSIDYSLMRGANCIQHPVDKHDPRYWEVGAHFMNHNHEPPGSRKLAERVIIQVRAHDVGLKFPGYHIKCTVPPRTAQEVTGDYKEHVANTTKEIPSKYKQIHTLAEELTQTSQSFRPVTHQSYTTAVHEAQALDAGSAMSSTPGREADRVHIPMQPSLFSHPAAGKPPHTRCGTEALTPSQDTSLMYPA